MYTPLDDNLILQTGKEVLKMEGECVLRLSSQLTTTFCEAVKILAESSGKVLVTGIGKSGIIGKKIAATLSSFGITAYFLHPVEALHGDLGMARGEDVLLVLSKSGNTSEVLHLVELLKLLKIPVITLTSFTESQIAKYSDVVIPVPVDREADHLNLAPTTSTTAFLAMGDALATAVAKIRQVRAEDFALYHPGGTLGKKLTLRISDLMHTGEDNPVVSESDTFESALFTVTSKRLGAVSVINQNSELVGIITDGDIRRLLGKSSSFTVQAVYAMKVSEVMTRKPKYIHYDRLATEALRLMEDYKITVLPVVDDQHHPIGMVHIHDLVMAGIGESTQITSKIRKE